MLEDYKNLPNENQSQVKTKNAKEIRLDAHRHLKAKASKEMTLEFFLLSSVYSTITYKSCIKSCPVLWP
jgi:hypothetical protein